VRQIRLGAGLRQWELAKMLGTTQSAVHKYEHGVVPEPRRLVALARIGGTSIEWVLTGQHWENGSREQQRLAPEVLRTACLLHEVSREDRATVDEALRVVRQALRAVEDEAPPENPSLPREAVATALREHGPALERLLTQAWRIQCAVLQRIAEDAESRLAAVRSVERGETGGPTGGPSASRSAS
jgi:transcriptional regulator with XRE-family HTH domain